MQAFHYNIVGNHPAVEQHGKGNNDHKTVAVIESLSGKNISCNRGEHCRKHTGTEDIKDGIAVC